MRKLLTKIMPLAYGKLFNIMVVLSPRTAAKKAFDVFCTIRKGQVLPIQKAYLDDAKDELVHLGDHHVQSYRWKGKKDTVLLLHGWESNTFRWRNLIKKLRDDGFDIVAFDAPAHGNSTGKKLHVPLYAEKTRHFIEKYNPRYIVAHSVGGMTILYDHYKNPESFVEKIVTIGAPCEFSQFMEHYQGLLKFNNKVWKAMDDYLKEWMGFHMNEFSSARFVANNTKKGLLFHDEEDLQVPFWSSQKVHEHWKNSALVATKGLGHSMHQEQINNQIVEFLNS